MNRMKRKVTDPIGRFSPLALPYVIAGEWSTKRAYCIRTGYFDTRRFVFHNNGDRPLDANVPKCWVIV